MTTKTKIIIAKCISFPVYFITMPISFVVGGVRGIVETWKMFIELDEKELKANIEKKRMSKKYDSRKYTKKHIKRVREYLTECMIELNNKAIMHDYDKIHNDQEKAMFDEYTPKLQHCTYGSEEYKSFLAGLKPALDIHYANNRHHPEHFENGIRGMNLLDVLEMVCDWKASSERHADGNIYKSIEINQERFGYSDDLKNLLKNTADFLIRKMGEK